MSLAYERHGDGPVLVLLHGVGHRRQAWNAVLPHLAPHRTVIAVDLPGHGESPSLAAGTEGTGDTGGADPVHAMGEELVRLFDELGLERPHIGGNSLGGALALGLAARGRAATVTGLSPAGFWASPWQYPYAKAVFKTMQATGKTMNPERTRRLARSTAGRAVVEAAIVARPSRMTPEQAAGDAAAFFRAREAVDRVLAEPLAFTDTVPASVKVTIAWGAKDRLLPKSQGRLAKRHLPHAKFVLLPGCGHVPMTDNPELVARVLLEGSTAP
ncbi:MAG TPA: alpha/beta hydrolase [Trebonia sp.]|jgi:pimeloyl-ACP methyl ester carboxylesterase|nr:alpha/beta hydrolase [Trebonia sp.]